MIIDYNWPMWSHPLFSDFFFSSRDEILSFVERFSWKRIESKMRFFFFYARDERGIKIDCNRFLYSFRDSNRSVNS